MVNHHLYYRLSSGSSDIKLPKLKPGASDHWIEQCDQLLLNSAMSCRPRPLTQGSGTSPLPYMSLSSSPCMVPQRDQAVGSTLRSCVASRPESDGVEGRPAASGFVTMLPAFRRESEMR